MSRDQMKWLGVTLYAILSFVMVLSLAAALLGKSVTEACIAAMTFLGWLAFVRFYPYP